MTHFKRYSFIFSWLVMISPAMAQQQATISQYMFNGMAINPAYAGSQGALTANFLSRFQNVGLQGAPNTQTLSIHSPLPNERLAVGFMVANDKIGVIGQTGVNGVFAYRLPMPNKATFSFGVQAGFSSYRAAYTKLETYQGNDPLFSADIRQTRPNFGAGVYYSTEKYYVGLSMPHMMNNVFERGTSLTTVYQNNPIMLSGGYVFFVNRMLKLKPNLLFKVVDKRAVELDLNLNMLFDEVVWVGVSYKVNNGVSLLLEMQLTDQLRFGYAYTANIGPVHKADFGSHELLLQYRFKYNMKGIVTPRYF
ncbi:MAG TPA: type IX secretion system membrane protein PorP/SprF [Cyclobacteriaceae bacterium]|nr:type IX secretion system membrane protein PorP/SprF [Cyclobacteriaceae bacterium]